MILSHKQIEEIAAAVTKDSGEFFFGSQNEEVVCHGLRPLISLQRIISV